MNKQNACKGLQSTQLGKYALYEEFAHNYLGKRGKVVRCCLKKRGQTMDWLICVLWRIRKTSNLMICSNPRIPFISP